MNRVVAFYQFIDLEDVEALRDGLWNICNRLGLRGTILLAPEGINGTLAGSPENIEIFTHALRTGGVIKPAFGRLECKFSSAGDEHFDRLKIKCKREIITFGQPAANPLQKVGAYVDAADWNALLDDPEVIVIDTRNGFEVAMGTFERAVDPNLTSFSQFPDFVASMLDPAKHRKIAMFCTGGIRCEKASAYMLEAGFAEVYHLQGGILKYLEVIPEMESRWRGDCFVFDRRVALGHGLAITGVADIKDSSIFA